jgi:hypothetical protein
MKVIPTTPTHPQQQKPITQNPKPTFEEWLMLALANRKER